MYKSSYPGGLRLPELGPLDKTIYVVLTAAASLGTVGAVIAFLLLFWKIPMSDPTVAGVEHTMGVFGLLIFCILMVVVIVALVEGWTRKYPIFGAAGVTYGEPEWTPVYPLMMPTRDAPEQVKQEVRQGREYPVYMLAGVILAAVIFATSLFSGNLLHEDGRVRVLYGLGWEVMEYQPEDVVEVAVEISRSGSGKGSIKREWRIKLSYRMDDDRLYAFVVNDTEFRTDGDQSQAKLLAQILESYTEADITFYNGGYIEEVVRDQQYSAEDQRLLEELFFGK